MQSSQGVRLELFHSSAKRTFVLCLLLVGATLAVYASAVQNDFVNFDDDVYIINNAHVRAGLTWETVKWSFTTFEGGNWAPLMWLSHSLDCELFGLHASGHHLVSALLHALNVAILFWVLQTATGFTWRSLAVALLFGFHPINVESVAWAAERKNVLSMLFFLLAFAAYGWYARRPGVRRYSLVFLLYSLALMSKPQVITFPFLLLLWDYWPLGRLPINGSQVDHDTKQFSAQWLVLEKLPLFLLSAADAVITVFAQRAGHALRTTSEYSLLNRTENALISYVRYLDLAVWPAKLAALYPHPEKLFAVWQVAGAAAILLLVTAAVLAGSRQRPALLVGWFWFVGSMFPMIGLVQVGGHALADRFAYIPFIGLFLMVVWGAADWGESSGIAPTPMITATALVLIALGAATHRQIGYWRDSPTLWLRALAVTENNFFAHDTMARLLAEHGREEEAAVHLRAALAIKPNDVVALLNLGNYEYEHGNLPSAIGRYQYVATYAADRELKGAAYGNLGSAYRQLGQYQESRRCYEESLRLTPGRVMAIVGMGLLAEHDGDFADAIRRFSNAMALQPNDVGYLLLADALERAGEMTGAQAARQQARRMSSNLDEAQKEADALKGAK
ncbi:MAG: tetratricopeptide repeat protein [Terriglobales bacterium]